MGYAIGADLDKVYSDESDFSLGAIYTDHDGHKYKFVKLLNETATVAGAAGDVVGYLDAPTSDAEQNTVVTDNSDAATKPIGAGVLQASVTGATGTAEYVWVQVTGYFDANQTVAGSPANGDALFLSTTDKTLTLATAADDPVCAYATGTTDNCIAAFPH